MATWNLESVGTKGYGGGGNYFCARAAKAFLKKQGEKEAENYDGVGVFKDPLYDTVYGQCTSSTRPVKLDNKDAVSSLFQPTELEQALAVARASCQQNNGSHSRHNGNCNGHSRHRDPERNSLENVEVTFEEPFVQRGGRKGGSMPLVCLGSGEHVVYVLQVGYNGRRWSVERRYREFDLLDKELQRVWGREPSVRLAEFPSKVWVGKMSRDVAQQRKTELEVYMKCLLDQPRIVRESDELRAFLELPPRTDLRPMPTISRPRDVQRVQAGMMESPRRTRADRDFDEVSL
ncbi:hypothetical protein GUITHDRAFT_119980 [Guillardia theta CCMP2712]|uniref:PX domain-containing protein n=1 Tax=Guillardia theta (strain CCMP2712) TaxID=905079 RepID=L1ID41_GUITC|nr:hypothetical protein GUITHDRAFT_119980 [Guillardia theta CCMP2712]EKX33809.1 hypothetical protein GUITHDRAFT_119980 [Guillardia theta CCMP2712]|eukprot:XP_005820789.1 hypothetical protein GUITHDRAFT_119980 [Guillardia theta CCMP2712]